MNEKKIIRVSDSPTYRSRIKRMIENAQTLWPTLTKAQKDAIKYMAIPLTEDFSKKQNASKSDSTPTDSVKY